MTVHNEGIEDTKQHESFADGDACAKIAWAQADVNGG